MLSEGFDLLPGQERQLSFSVDLPDDHLTQAITEHATQGAMPSMLRRDYDWWCVAEVEIPGAASLSRIERVPLAVEKPARG